MYDVVVCGGTLGIFAAVALQRAGLAVVLLERGPLRGREQEWNLSRKELHELAEVSLLLDAYEGLGLLDRPAVCGVLWMTCALSL